ncbi:MAG: MoxR family ATPase [Oligoflexia bacterium]|nr:MoxR family ATPase [Oligoflexia bacterium]
MPEHTEVDPKEIQEKFAALKAEVGKVLVGQDAALHRLMLGLLCGGHVLLEGVPGLAKTLMVRTLAQAVDATFSRIQFTPDMLPGDVTGTQVFNPREGTYSIKKGPIFGNLVLADEINRAPAKVQAALLEAMQEGQVTLGEQTLKLPEPFLVLATENPIEQEGTYPLPEAQLDRFMLKVVIGYPSREEEIKVIDRMTNAGSLPQAKPVITPQELLAARQATEAVFVDDKVKAYVVDLVTATRDPAAAGLDSMVPLIENGASVRASINLVKVAKAHALLQGRTYVTPHDVKTIAPDLLRHRLVLTYEAEAQGKTADDIVRFVLDNVEVP